MGELLGTQWNRTTVFIKSQEAAVEVLSIDDLAGHKVFYQKESHSWKEQVPGAEPVQNWREIKAGRKLDFPKFQNGGGGWGVVRGERIGGKE